MSSRGKWNNCRRENMAKRFYSLILTLLLLSGPILFSVPAKKHSLNFFLLVLNGREVTVPVPWGEIRDSIYFQEQFKHFGDYR